MKNQETTELHQPSTEECAETLAVLGGILVVGGATAATYVPSIPPHETVALALGAGGALGIAGAGVGMLRAAWEKSRCHMAAGTAVALAGGVAAYYLLVPALGR